MLPILVISPKLDRGMGLLEEVTTFLSGIPDGQDFFVPFITVFLIRSQFLREKGTGLKQAAKAGKLQEDYIYH